MVPVGLVMGRGPLRCTVHHRRRYDDRRAAGGWRLTGDGGRLAADG